MVVVLRGLSAQRQLFFKTVTLSIQFREFPSQTQLKYMMLGHTGETQSQYACVNAHCAPKHTHTRILDIGLPLCVTCSSVCDLRAIVDVIVSPQGQPDDNLAVTRKMVIMTSLHLYPYLRQTLTHANIEDNRGSFG